MVFTYFTDATALSNALVTKQIDIITSVQSPDQLSQFTDNADYVVSDGDSTTKELLAQRPGRPFDQALVRKAVYSAIDTKKLLSSIWGDYGTHRVDGPADGPLVRGPHAGEPVRPRARQAAARRSGLRRRLHLHPRHPELRPHAVAEFLQSELAKVGITVEINTISADEWYSKVFKERDFQATLQEHVNDRDVVWYGNPDFYWGYDNPEGPSGVGGRAGDDHEEQTAKLKLVNEQIAEDAASVWLYLYPQIVVAASDVSGTASTA
ncbi:ABC transporter substrate-binding protein [Plantibacter sp. M259]|uniref:ABC transporter substrate-binding protein n=1 Tax=Plantibacter sp. M259 TaxID=2583822 RepID=UPI001F0F616D|nr:ABC transporter substrate-binding protein [Plantibacter sp. M259]